jgi:hypothetical protein
MFLSLSLSVFVFFFWTWFLWVIYFSFFKGILWGLVFFGGFFKKRYFLNVKGFQVWVWDILLGGYFFERIYWILHYYYFGLNGIKNWNLVQKNSPISINTLIDLVADESPLVLPIKPQKGCDLLFQSLNMTVQKTNDAHKNMLVFSSCGFWSIAFNEFKLCFKAGVILVNPKSLETEHRIVSRPN